MLLSVLGITTEVRLDQPEKVPLPIPVTVLGIMYAPLFAFGKVRISVLFLLTVNPVPL
jgi:hypothetical protein